MNIIDEDAFLEIKEAIGANELRDLCNLLPDMVAGECATMRSAFASNDTDSFKRAAHTLKGTAANLCAVELSLKARELEMSSHDLDEGILARIDQITSLLEQTMNEMKRLNA